MYEVEMQHVDGINTDIINFICEGFDIDNNVYKFTNIIMENFKLNDFEVRNEDIGVIRIK